MTHYGKRFDEVLQLLRKNCPIKIPTKVVVRDLSKAKLCGSCTAYIGKNGKIQKFLIEVDKNMSTNSAIDTLMHEWAHAMDKEANGIPKEAHRNSWGVCYAKLWRMYVNLG